MLVRAEAVPSSENPLASVSSSNWSSAETEGRSSLEVEGIEEPGKGEFGWRWWYESKR